MSAIIDEIIDSLKRGQGKRVTDLVKMALEEGISAQTILEDGFLAGMEQIADKFRQEEVGVPEILSVTRALDKGVQSLRRYTGSSNSKEVGTVVLGTVEGDMHDIGKNLVKMMIEGTGIRVIDLGVDCPPERVVEAVKEYRPAIVCLSALLTTTMGNQKAVIDALKEAGLRDSVKVMVGGAPVTKAFAEEIGADAYTPDAATAAEVARAYFN